MEFKTKKLSYAVGLEINSLDLNQDLSVETIAALKELWLKHQLLLFKNQNLLPLKLVKFLSHFEHLSIPSQTKVNPKLHATSFQFDNITSAGNWAAKLSFDKDLAAGFIFGCVEAPHLGCSSVFVNQAMAWERLSPIYQVLIEGLQVVTTLQSLSLMHPIEMIHPATNQHALFIHPDLQAKIENLHTIESQTILKHLNRCQSKMEYSYRHYWEKNDVVLWDNRNTLHTTVTDNRHAESVSMIGAALVNT